MKVAGGSYVTGPVTAMMSNSPSGSSFSGGGGGGGAGVSLGVNSHPAYGSVHRVHHVQHLGHGHAGGHNIMMDNESIQSSDSSYGLAAKAAGSGGVGAGGPGSFCHQKKKG